MKVKKQIPCLLIFERDQLSLPMLSITPEEKKSNYDIYLHEFQSHTYAVCF